MIELQALRQDPEKVIDGLRIKNMDATAVVKRLLEVDAGRRNHQKQLDELLAEGKSLAKQIGALYQRGQAGEAEPLKEKTAAVKQKTTALQEALDDLLREQQQLLVQLPNLPHESVPPGQGPEDNVMVFQEGLLPEKDQTPVAHWDLAREFGLVDFEWGTKVTGAGFPVYKDKGARLQRALIAFFLDEAVAAGYTEYQPPLLVNEASAFGTGQLPDKDDLMYHIPADQLFLIPTAEVPVTNFFRDSILPAAALPVKCTAYSSCFRREAGSYGKDVRGLNRLHQFDKVEIVQVVRPQDSYQAIEEMLDYVTGLLRKLELPFRVMRLCGADISFAAALTYDLEVYAGAQQRWLEVSSISNFESFQSVRMKLRYRDEDGKIHLAHTLNGSALALPRIVAALLENKQGPHGIQIPPALVPYTGFEVIQA